MKTQIKVENISTKVPTLPCNIMIGHVEALEKRWRNSNKWLFRTFHKNQIIELYQLPDEIELMLSGFRNQQDYDQLKCYIEHFNIVENNMEHSNASNINICMSVVALTISIFMFLSVPFGPNEIIWFSRLIGLCAILAFISILHSLRRMQPEYMRKKSFYQIIAKYM